MCIIYISDNDNANILHNLYIGGACWKAIYPDTRTLAKYC